VLNDNFWLGDVGDLCVSTLERLKNKKGADISREDKVMRDVCLGYLFMLNVCNAEGVFEDVGLSGNLKRSVTIH